MKKVIVVDRNENHITTNRVQLWVNETMTGLISADQAKAYVRDGVCGVSTEQAIFTIPQNSKHLIYK